MIKLIITDMDGTLLNSKGEIDREFWDIEKKMQEKNILFAVASGRPYYNLVEIFDTIKDNTIFICENGSLVMYKNKEIFSLPIERDKVRKIFDTLENINDVVPIFCTKETAYIEKERYIASSQEVKNEIHKYYNCIEFIENYENFKNNNNLEIIKVAVCDFKGAEENTYRYFEHFKTELQIVVSGKVWIDLSKLGANKGLAVSKIQEKLNITYDETVIFGDYLNDYDMMPKAKYSYAMKNAHDELKKVANFITQDDNNNKGVINTIKSLI